jgi:hypothetical protein
LIRLDSRRDQEFLEGYVPHETWLLPEPLALELAHAARMAGQQPAGTCTRKVLEPLLNHKRAIEFLADAGSLGTIRRKVVQIRDTVYVPTQVPLLLEETFDLMLDKVRRINNPVEAVFFLWVHLACLQPFEDGNKHCSPRPTGGH